MTITKIGQKSLTLTERILTNKKFLNSLAKVSEHGTSFSAGTALALSTIIRPLAINSTPDVEKKNKQYAMANSIGSGLIKFGLVEAIALPIEYAVKKIDKTPDKYLKADTISNLSNQSIQNLSEAKPYKLLTQIIKLSTGFFTAIPKSMLTIALIPVLMDKIFTPKKKENKSDISNIHNKIDNKNINFTGKISDTIPKLLGKIIDNKPIQKFANKFQDKDSDIAKHITAGTDLLLTASFTHQTNKSDKIEENRKKVLIYNNWIATGITIIGGYLVDNIVKKGSSKFVENFKKLNQADPKLGKYIEGLNILRPTLIFAGIYYGILPIVSTYFSERVDNFVKKHQNK